MCAKCQNNIMLYLQVLRIRKILYVEEFLYLLHTCSSQVYKLILLIDDEIPGLLLLDTHDSVHSGQILHILTTLHLTCENITHFIKGCGLATLSGNNQRCTGLINQYGVHLIDDGKIQITKNQLLLVDNHVISQVIKAQLIIGNISDIAGISLLPLLGSHMV